MTYKPKHWHGIVASVLIAVVAIYLVDVREGTPDEHVKILASFAGLTFGALVEIGFLSFIELRETREKMAKKNDETLRLVSQLETNTTALVRHVGDRIERDENLHDILQFASSSLSSDQTRESWINLLNQLKKSYSATNYIDPHALYDSFWGRAAVAIQNGKKVANPTLVVRKVFLIGDELELLHLAPHIEEQRAIKVEAHYISIDLVNQDADCAARLKNGAVPSIDFGIFDHRTVLVWYVDGVTRAVTSGAVLHGSEAVEAHEHFFDALFKKASEYSVDRFALVRVPAELVKQTAVAVDGWRDEYNRGYTGDYENIDYSLRLSGGWLNTFRKEPGTRVYAAFSSGVFVGFSLLVGPHDDDKELYVAVRPGHLGKHFGSKLTDQTMRAGFADPLLARMHLKVRTHPAYRADMYASAGFKKTGPVFEEVVNHAPTKFQPMAITRIEFESKG